MRLLALLFALLCAPLTAQAYSYAAAGDEPLIDARQAVLAALNDGDWAKARKAVDKVGTELSYLTAHHDAGLGKALDGALAAKDKAATSAALRRAFTAEITRRLDGAKAKLAEYQQARVLLLKSQRFHDAIAGELAPDRRAAAEAGFKQALAAIGNPGVFGAGRRPADPEGFDAARQAILTALGN